MNSRERVLAVLNRERVDRLPIDIWHTEEVGQGLKDHFGARDDLDLYRKMEVDKIVWVNADYDMPDGKGKAGNGLTGKEERTMWGTPLKEQRVGQGVYLEFGDPPLRDCDTIDAIDRYPLWPDPDRFDYDGVAAKVDQAGRDFVTLGPWVSFFEIYCQMRGFEQALVDLATAPDLATALLDRIESIQTAMMERFFGRVAGNHDLAFVSDDMGTQTGLLISPAMWDTFFRERLQRWCDMIHSHGVKVFFHTDGVAEPLIPALLDCGIDVLNPIQHVCPGMDREGLKKKYGHRVIFHGGVENQQVLPFGSADDVRAETRECLRTLGAGREGYIACSCHNIQAGTPIENILAMVETVIAGE
jgi:uroporphyrinogen decarboxylase